MIQMLSYCFMSSKKCSTTEAIQCIFTAFKIEYNICEIDFYNNEDSSRNLLRSDAV
jgi:hypothetical protein